MKLAISNIAWSSGEDPVILPKLKEWGIQGLEVAPSRLFRSPGDATEQEISQVRLNLEAYGFGIVAMQSLLYGRPELELFGGHSTRMTMMEYLKKMVDLGSSLGARVLVFGNPKNRLRRSLPLQDALEIAIPFFRELGLYAIERGVWVCLEPNAPEYGCDFLTHTLEAHRFVQDVNQEGFGLHLDTSTMYFNQENLDEVLQNCLPAAKHFHLSEPSLAPLSQGKVRYEDLARQLRAHNYEGWLSMEMSRQSDSNNSESVQQCIRAMRSVFQ